MLRLRLKTEKSLKSCWFFPQCGKVSSYVDRQDYQIFVRTFWQTKDVVA
jgi:hypothetical protein